MNGKEVSYDALNATLSDNMKELTHTNGKFDIYKYNANKNTIFQLLGETLNDVMPKNVIDNYGMFCDVQTIPQGDTIVFHHKLGKRRAKQFITRVAHAGRYEVFELADESSQCKQPLTAELPALVLKNSLMDAFNGLIILILLMKV